MADTILESLRDRLVDESEPLAGLLRKCLMLGAATSSDALRDWARRELNGYRDEDEVPEYRTVRNPVIVYDAVGGFTVMTGMTVDRLQLPASARDSMTDDMTLKQPIEELEELAKQDSITFKTGALTYAEMVWNSELDQFQQVMNLRHSVAGSTVAGIVSQVRTKLVDIVADLTSDTPLTELPASARVDAAVRERVGHFGDIYHTNINQPAGPTAVGHRASATGRSGLEIEEVLRLLSDVTHAVREASEEYRVEVELAVQEMREVLEQTTPDTGEVVVEPDVSARPSTSWALPQRARRPVARRQCSPRWPSAARSVECAGPSCRARTRRTLSSPGQAS